jgi:DNA-binding GntR family transcriptional regulator
MGVSKNNSARLAQNAYEAVRDAIEEGQLPPGERISEYRVADWLKISRTPAREGLLRLEADGLLTHHPRRGLVVASIDIEALKEVFVAREVLERALAGLAARNGSGPELDAILATSAAEPELVENRDKMYQHNKQFHGQIRRAAHNRYLEKFISTLEDIVAADRRGSSLVDPARRHAVIAEHAALAQAIADRDVNAAQDLASGHIRAACEARLKIKPRREEPLS